MPFWLWRREGTHHGIVGIGLKGPRMNRGLLSTLSTQPDISPSLFPALVSDNWPMMAAAYMVSGKGPVGHEAGGTLTLPQEPAGSAVCHQDSHVALPKVGSVTYHAWGPLVDVMGTNISMGTEPGKY